MIKLLLMSLFCTVDTENVVNLQGTQKIKFKPSAAAIHPITKELILTFIGSKSYCNC